MKNFKNSIGLLLVILTISCDKNSDASSAPAPSSPTTFNTDNYTQYVTCKAGDFVYNVGNNVGNTTSVYAFKSYGTLYLTSSDGNFVSGSTLPMEINLQLKNFDAVNLKSYDVSGTYPAEILKFNHANGDNYDTNNGVNTTAQVNAVTITKIENGFYTGTFSFTVYKISNRTTTVQVNQGNFKFKL